MKKYIVESFTVLGEMLLILMATATIGSPLLIGLILGEFVNNYWYFLIFGIFITLPMGIALIRWLIEEKNIFDI